MKVKELIARLQLADPDSDVALYDRSQRLNFGASNTVEAVRVQPDPEDSTGALVLLEVRS